MKECLPRKALMHCSKCRVRPCLLQGNVPLGTEPLRGILNDIQVLDRPQGGVQTLLVFCTSPTCLGHSLRETETELFFFQTSPLISVDIFRVTLCLKGEGKEKKKTIRGDLGLPMTAPTALYHRRNDPTVLWVNLSHAL